MKLTYSIFTNNGNREVNEDTVGEVASAAVHCFVVADGLGGHGHGEIASAIAVDAAKESFMESADEDVLARSFETAQERVLSEQGNNPMAADMKTTMVDLILKINGIARWGHIGDSRLYFFRDGELAAHTLDHSVPQMLVNLGEITFEEIRGHEDRNRLIRVIGTEWEGSSYELSQEIAIRDNDSFLMCTDGFWELINEQQMVETLKNAKSVEEWMNSMVEIVMENGKDVNMDNNSAIAVWFR